MLRIARRVAPWGSIIPTAITVSGVTRVGSFSPCFQLRELGQ
ncbi:MAG: hypothetical protein NVS4B9_42250 [Ktedonobacteraceae bacterium]